MRHPRFIVKSLLPISLLAILRPWLGIVAFVMLVISVHLAYRDGRRRYAEEEAMAGRGRVHAAIEANAEVVPDAAA